MHEARPESKNRSQMEAEQVTRTLPVKFSRVPDAKVNTCIAQYSVIIFPRCMQSLKMKKIENPAPCEVRSAIILKRYKCSSNGNAQRKLLE